MAADDEQKRESAEHADIDTEKAARNGLAYTENPELEKRITRKCDFHILPWIFVLWLLAFIDRSNIGTIPPRCSLEPIANGNSQAMLKSTAWKRILTYPARSSTWL
jgi:hypothetical protein